LTKEEGFGIISASINPGVYSEGPSAHSAVKTPRRYIRKRRETSLKERPQDPE